MKLSRFDRPYQEYEKWRGLCLEGHWKRVPASDLEGMLPQPLLEKTNTVLILSSGTPKASAYVTNLYRVDQKDGSIDQEPYVVTFDHSASQAQGYFVHHGEWPGRSLRPDPDFFNAVSASGIHIHYPYASIPSGSSGPMSDVHAHEEAGAFWETMKKLRADKDR